MRKKGILIFIIVVILIAGIVTTVIMVNNAKKEALRRSVLQVFEETGKGGIDPNEYLDALQEEVNAIKERTDRITGK